MPLTSAVAKLERAREHHREISQLASSSRASTPFHLAPRIEPTTGHQIWSVTKVRQPDTRVSLVLADAVHNYRCALDHLIHAMVVSSGGIPTRATAMPILETAPQDGMKVSGLSHPAMLAWIAAHQPYAMKGHRSAAFVGLRDVDNSDKHRAVRVVAAAQAGALWIGGSSVAVKSGIVNQGDVLAEFDAANYQLYFEPIATVSLEEHRTLGHAGDVQFFLQYVRQIVSQLLEDARAAFFSSFPPVKVSR